MLKFAFSAVTTIRSYRDCDHQSLQVHYRNIHSQTCLQTKHKGM